MKRIWHFLGDIRWTFWLLLLISADLAAGSYVVKAYPAVFRPLAYLLFQDWFAIYGENHLDKTWWLWLLLGLSFALAVNTCICTLNRLGDLWPKRKQMGGRAFFHKACPSLIHICFLVVLAGHFLLLVTGFNQALPVKTGAAVELPAGRRVQVMESCIEYYTSPQMFKNLVRQGAVVVKIDAPGEVSLKELHFLQPGFWHGFSLHLGMDKKAGPSPGLRIMIRRDSGAILILPGFAALVSLAAFYFWAVHKKRSNAVHDLEMREN